MLLIATLNAGKIREIKTYLASLSFDVVGLESLPSVALSPETGSTFEENARQKAAYYSRRTDHLTLADDSGVEVDALHREPGVHSARFLGIQASDEERCREILRRMQSVPALLRSARFVCMLALAKNGKVLQTFEGRVEGRIATESSGKGGFGYDPIFLLPELGKTMAELSPEEKNRCSHRGKALSQLQSFLSQYQMVTNSRKT